MALDTRYVEEIKPHEHKILPRIGEGVVINEYSYTIYDVAHNIDLDEIAILLTRTGL